MTAETGQALVAALAASHGGQLRRFLSSRVRNAADIPDLIQEVYLRMLRIPDHDAIRSPEAYLVPRSDGRILVGTTVEEAGFDKRTDVATIQRLHRAAIALVPTLKNAKILEDWAGLRPGTPDALPILGATSTPGYYVATGHFRDGILLAPITARVMADVIEEKNPDCDLGSFSAARFTRAPVHSGGPAFR